MSTDTEPDQAPDEWIRQHAHRHRAEAPEPVQEDKPEPLMPVGRPKELAPSVPVDRRHDDPIHSMYRALVRRRTP